MRGRGEETSAATEGSAGTRDRPSRHHPYFPRRHGAHREGVHSREGGFAAQFFSGAHTGANSGCSGSDAMVFGGDVLVAHAACTKAGSFPSMELTDSDSVDGEPYLQHDSRSAFNWVLRENARARMHLTRRLHVRFEQPRTCSSRTRA